MAATTVKRRRAVARLASLERHCPESERTTDARRDVHVIAMEEHIQKLVDEAPPLSSDQRNKLAMLLLAWRPTA
jgi:hypothetical protein